VKDKLDYSRVPEVREDDLEEQFIHGSGPGGQAVNKAHNCVLLKHLPTGVVVKVHEHREAHKNALLAREHLQSKLDDFLNGEDSISNQIKRIEKVKSQNYDKKATLKRDLKKAFKSRQGPK
jgi:protein subunit release factor B